MSKLKIKNKFVFIILLAVVIIAIFWYRDLRRPSQAQIYGVTFNSGYARYLKLDPKKVYSAILNEWKFKYVRLSAQWDELETQPGKFDFSELDWLMDESAKSGVKIILAVGQKTPRWPECHIPGWAAKLSEVEYRQALNNYVKQTVERYKNHPALEIWQVDNEPFLPFGICPPFSKEMLAEELNTTKQIDPDHPTLVTDSGELSAWRRTARVADLFGTTMYRVVWNKYLGYFNYDWLFSSFYRFKLWLNQRPINQAYIIELQAEPWIINRPVEQMLLTDQYKSMDLARLKKNLDFAGQTGFPRSYLWGAEWWYWLKEKGKNEIPDFIAGLKK